MASEQVVTRDEFEAFLANPNGDGPLFDILRSIPEAQRQPLFDVGKSICKIETDADVGSGFHLASGWILTALHVISDKHTMGAEYVSQLTFQFPNEPVIEAASRSCIFPILPPNSATAELKDIALVYVPEVIERESSIPELGSGYQEPPETGDLAHLVHFGDDHQQFSINGKIIPNPKGKRPPGYSYSTFKGYCPYGSSGAPLLIFKEVIKKFLVGGVHFAGCPRNTYGYVLHFTKENWLHSTVRVASITVAKILSDAFEGDCYQTYIIPFYENLQKHLKNHNLKIIVNKYRPSFLAGEFENIIFKSE